MGVSTTESEVAAALPPTGTIDRLEVYLETSARLLQSWDVTLRVAGSDFLTCSLGLSADRCQDLAHSAAASAGQTVTLRLVPSTLATLTRIHWRARPAMP